MKRYIIITTIFNPTKAVKAFASLSDYKLLVVGDKKTPVDWYCENVLYYSIDEQQKSGLQLSKVLPENHYSRKMFGYVQAIRMGAEIIIDTDDDNIILDNWGFPQFEGSYLVTPKNRYFINIYRYFSDQHIWPRGLPLDRINNPNAIIEQDELSQEYVKVGIWQGLANGDPDVDAIYRLTSNEFCIFKQKPPLVLNEGTFSPFNSQNTAFTKELFPLLYLPAHVTFRFTDILRSYVAQPIMWLFGYKLGFLEATVLQERNEHNYLKDFELEIPCYLNVDKVVESVSKSIRKEFSIKDNLYEAYHSLVKDHLLEGKELDVVEAWLNSI